MNRRNFIKQSALAGMACSIPQFSFSETIGSTTPSDNLIWACLMHLSFNFAGRVDMWGGIRTQFEPDEDVWDMALKKMSEKGVNMLLINLDDSVLWRSHPEIALKNSWTPEILREKLTHIRGLGIEPIPMFNFSATHDAWLGKYSRMVSTTQYYNVCKDLIAEAIEIFDTPRFIHFGMDEETLSHQQALDYVVIRRENLWWGDLYFYIGEAFKHGVRPWVWSDYVWNNPDNFFKMMPKSVLQSNWYYGEEFDRNGQYVKGYIDLNREGYDQIPTGSFNADPWNNYKAFNVNSIGNTVKFCSQHISSANLMGFLQTFWMPTTQQFKPTIIKAIELMGYAKINYIKNK